MPPFEVIWERIVGLQGQQFATISGLPFTYRVDGDALYPSRTDYRLSRGDVETAFGMVPIPGPGTINNEVRGPAYIWAILHDQRVAQGAWAARPEPDTAPDTSRLRGELARSTIHAFKPRVYVETTIPSYLTAWPSRNLLRAAHQQVTREWWDRRGAFDLFISPQVLIECEAGDPEAAAERLAAVADLPLLDQTADVTALAEALAREVPVPPKATADAVHIATAAVHGMHYLLTWNCTHIANVTLRPRIEAACRRAGYEPPLICTPQELPPPEVEP